MRRRVVIGWDGTPATRNALDWALRWWGAEEVDLVSVGDRAQSSAEYFVAGSLAAHARVDLMEHAEAVRQQHPDISVTSRLEHGDAAEVLAAAGSAEVCVVLGTTRRGHPSFRYGWSVANRVAAIAPGPVVVVPTFEGESTSAASSDRTRIVVAVDGSIGEMTLVQAAASEALRTGGGLTVVHAWTPPVWAADDELTGAELRVYAQERGRMLDETVAAIQAEHPSLRVAGRLIQDEPAPAISAAARDAALLVLGRHGVSRLQRMFLGSVSHSVLLDLPAPTLVLPLQLGAGR